MRLSRFFPPPLSHTHTHTLKHSQTCLILYLINRNLQRYSSAVVGCFEEAAYVTATQDPLLS